jgi:predicted Rossmann fold nucleotide-binding protein DprA/Smf involved in DNA uptake
MECKVCQAKIAAGEAREHNGRMLCEDCFMDALSPTRMCDPWAVHSAKGFAAGSGRDAMPFTDIQQKILDVLADRGTPPAALAAEVGLTPADLERELATLRHMEKIRARLQDGQKVVQLW